MQTDIEIAPTIKLKSISEIGAQIGIPKDYLELYGQYKAKVNLDLLNHIRDHPYGKLILVTATTPTPAGEGKTTTTIGLGLSLNRLGKKAIVCLREPSLGPVFGVKGGATGGGKAQVLPMEDINLHFTGDFHAVSAAGNLLAALLDNHLYQGNELQIDAKTITWKRCMDMNDRALRQIKIGLGDASRGIPRTDGFEITAASEVMAVFCLSQNLTDLKKRLGKIIIGFSKYGTPVTAKDLRAEAAMAVLLKDAMKPNLVQTSEGTPALIHGGPFANIAHGANSTIATGMAFKLADYVITEAGFAADLGAEKFFDIVLRTTNFRPAGVVLVTTVRSLKMHGGGDLSKGLPNLVKHLENIRQFGLPVLVAINRFTDDLFAELELIRKECLCHHVLAFVNEVWSKGSAGGIDLAGEVMKIAVQRNSFHYLYDLALAVSDKIETIAHKIYGADNVIFTTQAKKDLQKIKKLGFENLPVCIAKTQASLSDNPKLKGVPQNFSISIQKLKISAGAGFIVAFAGKILTMHCLQKGPAAVKIDLDKDGYIRGLF